jgi:hypothetical protein
VSSYVDRYRGSGHCALSRANPVFGTDEKRIRTKNTVMDKSKGGLGWPLYEIVDCKGVELFFFTESES